MFKSGNIHKKRTLSGIKPENVLFLSRLNEEGIIIDDVIVFRIQGETFWVSTLFIDELIAWFDAHKAGEQVTYREITGITTMYAVQGSDSRKVLNAFLKDSIDDLKFLFDCSQWLRYVILSIET